MFLFTVSSPANSLASYPASASLFKVVIDPGHGGADEGTVYHAGGFRIAEKDVTLRIARQVANLLRAKGYWVTLTRNEDREVSLPARTALANQLKADIFISIHMNSEGEDLQSKSANKYTGKNASKSAEGVETFILNHTTDAASKRLAKLENSAISINSPYSSSSPNAPSSGSQSPEIQQENLDVALILKDLRLDANLSESKHLACDIQRNLVSATSRSLSLLYGRYSTPIEKRNRGVKQALFHVLLGADMPSVLVEPGFLSNDKDRSLVLSEKGRFKISHAISDAIEQYRGRKWKSKRLLSLSRCKVD